MPAAPVLLPVRKPTYQAMASDAGDRNSTLKRCLGVLRDARNDSEQFAALLLVRNRCGAAPWAPSRAPSPQERAGGRRNPPLETRVTERPLQLCSLALGASGQGASMCWCSQVEGAWPWLGCAEGWSALPRSGKALGQHSV